MAMTACYSNYGLLGSQRHRQQHQTHPHPAQLLTIPIPQTSRIQTPQIGQKDFSIPLHVDCSVEYELPNQAKPPPGSRVEPLLLMIHPCYFRKIESEQRRSPFINNMPNTSRQNAASSSSVALHPSQSVTAGVSHGKDKSNHTQIIQRTIHHSSQHIATIDRHKLTAATASQQACYPANNKHSSNRGNNTIFSSNITNSTLAGVQLCLDNWENVSELCYPHLNPNSI